MCICGYMVRGGERRRRGEERREGEKKKSVASPIIMAVCWNYSVLMCASSQWDKRVLNPKKCNKQV